MVSGMRIKKVLGALFIEWRNFPRPNGPFLEEKIRKWYIERDNGRQEPITNKSKFRRWQVILEFKYPSKPSISVLFSVPFLLEKAFYNELICF